MDQEFPVDTVEGQKRIAYFRKLKILLKRFAGRYSLHNFVSGGATPDDSPSIRRIDRFHHKEIITLEGSCWAVFSISGDLFLKGQAARLMGLVLGISRGWLPEEYLDAAMCRETVLDIPPVPGCLIYLAECKFAYYEAACSEDNRLDPRRRYRGDCLRINEWRKEIYQHIAQQYTKINSNSLDSGENGRTSWLEQFRCQCLEAKQHYEILWSLRSRSDLQLRLNLTASEACLYDENIPKTYRRVLGLLRAADLSGLWPPST
jgi:hypothetical protein